MSLTSNQPKNGTRSFLRLKEPMNVTAPIACELQQKLPLMTAMSDVPDAARQEMAFGARHRVG
jgi:hypothetical protein